MDIHDAPIAQRIEWLFDLADRHGAEFRRPDAALNRRRYQAQHPSAIAVMKCMDGRINLPLATNTPVGVLMAFRNLGGIFDLGWPHLGEVLTAYVHDMVGAGRRVMVLITYHFSRGSARRGCAGFHNDTAAAIAHVRQIRRQLEQLFGPSHDTVYPLVCGFETDEDALIIHGTDDAQVLDMAACGDADRGELALRLAAVLPDMPTAMRADLLPLLAGNLEHIGQVRATRRGAIEVEHREWVICLGRGFDFLHTPNTALIIGPYSPDLALPVQRAAGIIESNMKAGRVRDDGLLLLTSAPYQDLGIDRARAELKSRFLSGFASEVIAAAYPELAAKMTRRTAVLDWSSRRLEIIESERERTASQPGMGRP